MDEPVPQPIGPAAKSKLPLIGLGLATSAVALFGVWALNQATEDFNLMGLYYLYILPAGAILVGAAAGSGYGMGSWWSGVRISRGLLWSVVGLQVAVYFVAQYIEFRHILATAGDTEGEVGFFTYFDWATRQIAFKGRHDQEYGDPLGAWGYAFRALEVAGFVFGGLLVPLALRSKPYCESCQIYMRTRALGLLPAGAPVRKVKKKDEQATAEYQQEVETGWQAGMQELDALRQHVGAGRTADATALLENVRPRRKEIDKMTGRIAVSLSACPVCATGLLQASLLTGQGDKIRRENLGASSVHPSTVRDLTAK